MFVIKIISTFLFCEKSMNVLEQHLEVKLPYLFISAYCVYIWEEYMYNS